MFLILIAIMFKSPLHFSTDVIWWVLWQGTGKVCCNYVFNESCPWEIHCHDSIASFTPVCKKLFKSENKSSLEMIFVAFQLGDNY